MKPVLQIAVRTLVEFTQRNGDLDRTFHQSASALEGIRGHRKIQSSRPEGYHPEVPVKRDFETDRYRLVISGRIDGVWSEDGKTVVEEIKTTGKDLDTLRPEGNDLHWSQLKVYAWLYAEPLRLETVEGLLTYYRHSTGEILEIRRLFQTNDLGEFVADLIERYLSWADLLESWQERRNTSIRDLSFPYSAYRPGQREMAVAIFRAVRDGGHLMVQAPTGIGKTVAALFPVLKAMAEGHTDKSFYLTARTTGRSAAEFALQQMRETGLRFRALTLTAKDRICFLPESACVPEECSYARGHYDRLNDALRDAMTAEALTRGRVEELARRFHVCPFEFSLDLAMWADAVICDYNYAFDPRVHLRRFFQDNPAAYTFLVDEAHNLVDRSREMFSAELTQQAVRNLRRSVRSDLPGLHRSLGRLNRWLLAERKAAEVAGGEHWRPEAPAGMEPLLRSVLIQAERILARNEKTSWREPLLEFYFEGTNFLRVMEGYDASYATCLRAEERSLRIKLFCVDPAARMREAIGRARTVVFYSATLAPPAYFLNMFGCAQETPVLRLPSPYPPERLHLLIDDRTSTFFRERDATGPRVADAIHALVSGRRGNYLCFFPAYKYMDDVHEMFRALHPEWTTLVQNPEMTEEERERFLSRFDQENPETLVGFAVMGGIFGEGIDLVGDRLSGAVVVGVGLPGLCAERDLIRSFFDEKLASGFEYAYQYPGMNRVLQAVGRVIRSDEDRGVVLLIDCRYRTARYRDLFPREWRPVTASEPGVIAGTVAAFWARHR